MESDIRFSIMGVGRSNNLQGTLSIKKGNCMGNEEALTGESDVKKPRIIISNRNYLYLAMEQVHNRLNFAKSINHCVFTEEIDCKLFK